MMKNIIIGILIVVTMLSVVYAFFQQSAAERARYQAEQNLVSAMGPEGSRSKCG